MKVFVFTGARSWEASGPIIKVLRKLAGTYGANRLLIVEGGAPGVDTLTRHACKKLGIHCATIPALWDSHNRAAGHIRNEVLLWLCPEAVIAFHWDLNDSKGTADMVRRARRKDVRVIRINATKEVAMPSVKHYREAKAAKKKAKQS